MKTPCVVIYVDPVGDAASYSDFSAVDLVLIAHEHGDHFNQKTLDAVAMESTVLITNPNVYDTLSDAIQVQVIKIANGENPMLRDVTVGAIAA